MGAYRFVVYFDDDQSSDTYAERVTRCPDCGIRLHGNALEPHDIVRGE